MDEYKGFPSRAVAPLIVIDPKTKTFRKDHFDNERTIETQNDKIITLLSKHHPVMYFNVVQLGEIDKKCRLVMYVDDSGVLQPNSYFQMYPNYQPYAGTSVLVAQDKFSQRPVRRYDHEFLLQFVNRHVTWLKEEEARNIVPDLGKIYIHGFQ